MIPKLYPLAKPFSRGKSSGWKGIIPCRAIEKDVASNEERMVGASARG